MPICRGVTLKINLSMQPAPAPSAGRGEAVLQPAYFTSALYVQALRDDISTLTNLYRERYSRDRASSPATSCFALFKQLWTSENWQWLHFRVFDDRARETFLLVTVRLFMGAAVSPANCRCGHCFFLKHLRRSNHTRRSSRPDRRNLWGVYIFLYSTRRYSTETLPHQSQSYSLRDVRTQREQRTRLIAL